jgi:hypothetical protein
VELMISMSIMADEFSTNLSLNPGRHSNQFVKNKKEGEPL